MQSEYVSVIPELGDLFMDMEGYGLIYRIHKVLPALRDSTYIISGRTLNGESDFMYSLAQGYGLPSRFKLYRKATLAERAWLNV